MEAPGAAELKIELESLGARVSIKSCDVAERSAVEALLTELKEDAAPLRAVVHTAGVASYVPLTELTDAQLSAELGAKVSGAWHLHELLAGHALDAFILYSSIAGLWGSGQQAAYSAANSALDALGCHRRAAGQPATVIAWGPWSGGGLVDQAEDLIGAEQQLAKRGLNPMAPARAIEALGAVVGGNRVTVGVVDVDWARFAPSFASMRERPLLEGIAEVALATQPEAFEEDVFESERSELTSLSFDERLVHMLTVVQREVASVLELRDAEGIDPDEPLDTLGLDSLMAVQLRDRFSRLTGTKLSATLAFDYPTPRALSEYFSELLGASQPAAVMVRDTSDLASLVGTLTDAELDTYGLRAGLERLVEDQQKATGEPAEEAPEDESVDVESMDTDDLLSLLQQKYGKDGDV